MTANPVVYMSAGGLLYQHSLLPVSVSLHHGNIAMVIHCQYDSYNNVVKDLVTVVSR